MTHSYMWHDSDAKTQRGRPYFSVSFMCVSHDSFMWYDASTWQDSSACDTWLIHVTWLIHMWHMTHPHLTQLTHTRRRLCVWHDSLIHVTWLRCEDPTWEALLLSFMHVCDMTHPHVWHAPLVHVVVHVCDMTHSYMWHDSDAKTQHGRPYFSVSSS